MIRSVPEKILGTCRHRNGKVALTAVLLATTGSHYQDVDEQSVRPLFQLLYDNNAELVLNGRDHNYQRWAPQDLMLTLHASSYDWQFVPEAGQTWTDSGSTNYH